MKYAKRLLKEYDLSFQTAARKAQMLDRTEKQSGSHAIKLSQAAAVRNPVTIEKSTVLTMQKLTLKAAISNRTSKQNC